jgi:hypothetical protein
MQTFHRDFSARSAALAFSVVLAFASGCDANHVLGTEDKTGAAGALGGADAGAAGTPVVTPVTDAAGTAGTDGGTSTGAAGMATLMAGPLGPTQSWTGYVEQFMFPSGSDALKLTFATDAKGVAKGAVVFGNGTPPAPATNPNIGYPPAFNAAIRDEGGFGQVTAPDFVAEGFSYAFDGGSFDSDRLRFTVDMAQLWAGWCALQRPATDPASTCFPGSSASGSGNGPTMTCAQINPTNGQSVAVDCAEEAVCFEQICACSASSCGLASPSHDTAVFDVFLSGDTLSGSVDASFVNQNQNVHFVKDGSPSDAGAAP